MSAPLWFQNLAAFSLQFALVGAVGLLLPRALRLRKPRALYYYWQALLALGLVLPLVQPWHRLDMESGPTAASRIIFDSGMIVTRFATLPGARLILLALAAGMALRLMWLAMGLLKLRRFRQSARRIAVLPPGIEAMARRLGAAPEFCLGEEIQGPVTFGLWRPVILLPPRFLEMDADRQRVIASHELLHVARRDWALNLAEEIVIAALWFHPVAWWLVGRIRLSREQVVDQQVVELTGARKPYLYALVEIAAAPGASRSLVAPAFLQESQLAERIRSLIKEDGMSRHRIIFTLACVVVVTVVAALAAVHKFPLRAGVGQALAANSSATAPGIYTVGAGVSAPVPIYKPEPPYSEAAKHAKIEGSAVLSVVVGADGAVKGVTLVKALESGLDQNAIDTIKTWKFKPAMKAGQPVPVRVTVEVSFRIF